MNNIKTISECEGTNWTDNRSSQNGEIVEMQLWSSAKVSGLRVKYGQIWSAVHGSDTETLQTLALGGD